MDSEELKGRTKKFALAAMELVELLSNELQVTTNTPPCFVWCTYIRAVA